MAQSFRKLTRRDFQKRANRVAPGYAGDLLSKVQNDQSPSHPILSAGMGFLWGYLTLSIATRRAEIEGSLTQGSLPAQTQHWVMMALAAFVTVSAVMLVLHLIRMVILRGGKRSNSRGVLIGAVLAGGVIYSPPELWETGGLLIDAKTHSLLRGASEQVETILPEGVLDRIIYASSMGR
ncbi:MAG: hypothetical protein N4A53_15550 [Pelagimonas sp.]|jgi:hypothetical protein|nr:hypothetical protein [Pelagimonas sp.]